MVGSEVAAYFADLGADVSRRWDRLGRTVPCLSEAAYAALEAAPPDGRVGAGAVLDYAARGGELPEFQSRLDDDFGQPPLVMFAADDFYIQALTWIDGTTDVHQHGFDGAFALAEGMSLHVLYGFECAEQLADGHLVTGQMTPDRPEVLRPGTVRPILSGFGFIHALFHLERPTVTVVIRNRSSGLTYPQYSYLRPGLGFDRLWSARGTGRRLQALGALHRIGGEGGLAALTETVGTAPVWVAFLVLRDACRRGVDAGALAAMCATVERRAPALRGLLAPALRAEVETIGVLRRRGLLSQPHQRLLLAVLANLHDRAGIQAAVEGLYPAAATDELILGWIDELASPAWRGVSGVRLNEEQRALVVAALRGRSDADGGSPSARASAIESMPVLLRGLVAG